MSKIPTCLHLFALFSLVAVGGSLGAQDSASFKVIVNAANPVSSMTQAEVSRMFLKKTREWEGGGEVVPIDLESGSAVREEFSQKVHGKSVLRIRSYWQTLLFSGRAVPPPEMPSESDVLSFVKKEDHAIGYVSEELPVDDGVKVIVITTKTEPAER